MISYYCYPGLKFKNEISTRKNRGCYKPSRIVSVVADFFEITVDEIMTRNRKRKYVYPRQVAMYFLKTESTLNYVAIGEYFSMDHSSIMFSCKNIRQWIKNDENVKMQIDSIKMSL